jgi:hypothetical protein
MLALYAKWGQNGSKNQKPFVKKRVLELNFATINKLGTSKL